MTGLLRLIVVAALCYLVVLLVLRLSESRMLYVPGGNRMLLDPPPELRLDVRRVTVTASDGVRLVAWAMPVGDGSGYWLLMCQACPKCKLASSTILHDVQ